MPDPAELFSDPKQYWDFITSTTDAEFENQHFDRKQAGNNGIATPSSIDKLQDEIKECISAFANHEGGVIIVGISKTGDIHGINHLNPDQLKRITSINQLLRNQSAMIKYMDCINKQGESERILLIYVPVSDGICETLKSPPEAWIRNGDRCEPLTDDLRELLKREKRIVEFERMPCCSFDPGDIDKEVLAQFRQSNTNLTSSISDEDFLYQIGALGKDKNGLHFTNAGYLFFASRPQRMLSWAHVRLMRFDAKVSEYKTRGLPTFDREFDGPLAQQIRKLRVHFRESGFFKTYQKRAADGGFIEEPEFPTLAVDEAIVNAVAHRDYGIRLPIECILYKDGFFVENPGRVLQRSQPVPDHFNLAQITLDSMPRNSLLIQWLKNMRGDDGRAFVQALSEGTKRMHEEMSKLNLTAPAYQTSIIQTSVILLSNAEEREAAYRAASITAAATEFANLFPLRFTGENSFAVSPKIFRGRMKELEQYLIDSLSVKGWYIDRKNFGKITAHRKGANLPIPDNVSSLIQFSPAYIFQFKLYGEEMFLCVDYTLEVKNRSNVRNLLRFLTSQDLVGRHAVAKTTQWLRGRIIRVDFETTLIRFDETEGEEFVASSQVLPELPISLIEKNLKSLNIRFDLFREIKKSSLSLDPNSSRLRADKSIATVGELASSVFPLFINDLTVTLDKTPLPLFRGRNGSLTVQSLAEPVVEFNKKHETPDIREGITRYGSYDSSPKTIELIPICLAAQREGMKNLIERLKAGKFKYSGAERTFHTRLSYNAIITVPSTDQILEECKRLLNEHDDWRGDPGINRLFLVHTPEQDFSLDDEKSPYYQVKRFLLEQGIPCQMVDTPTLQNPDWKDLNLALNITAKCGVTPWVLPDSIPNADFFIGLSYTQSHSKGLRRLLGYSTVFNKFGNWEFYSGNTDAFSYEERSTFFAQLAENTLKQITQTSSLSDKPNIYFHYSAKFSKDDIAVIVSAARRIRPQGTYHFVSINSHHNIRLYDNRPETDGSMSRGSYVITSPRQIVISTTGYNPYRKAIGTPKPLEVSIWVEPPNGENKPQTDLKALANQILSLTKLNWSSTDSLCGEPITIKYAGDIAYLTDAFLRQSESFKLHQVLEKTPWFI